MNKLLIALAFAIACSGLAYGAGRFSPALSGPTVIAGALTRDGHVMEGSGFVSRHIGTGEYEIRLSPSAFQGCGALVVTPISNENHLDDIIAVARQQIGCAPVFRVTITFTTEGTGTDHPFQFILASE